MIVQSCIRKFLAKRKFKRLKAEARSVEHVKSLNKGLEMKIINLQHKINELVRKNKSLGFIFFALSSRSFHSFARLLVILHFIFNSVNLLLTLFFCFNWYVAFHIDRFNSAFLCRCSVICFVLKSFLITSLLQYNKKKKKIIKLGSKKALSYKNTVRKGKVFLTFF